MVLHGGALLIADAAHRPAARWDPALPPRRRRRVRLLARRPTPAGAASRRGRCSSSRTRSCRRLGRSRLELRTTIGNEPSERVAERAGFERVGPEPPIEYPAGRVVETTLWTRELEAVTSASGRRRGRRGLPSRRRRSRPAPLTWPERTSEASTTTCAATSSGWADLPERHRPRDPPHGLGVDEPAGHRRLGPARRDRVDAGPRARSRVTSFFSDRSSPPWSADFAAA